MLRHMWMAMACSAPSPSRFAKNSSSRAWSRRVSSASCSAVLSALHCGGHCLVDHRQQPDHEFVVGSPDGGGP